MKDNRSVRYITLSCVHGGKAKNRTNNLAKPFPSMNIKCKAKIIQS